MIAYKINVTDQATPMLARLVNGVQNPQALNADVGRRATNELREHFRQRNISGPRNRFGAPSSGFWDEIRQAVGDARADNDGATVTVAHAALAQKVYGGKITMDNKLLAIPARAEAYGKSPRLFDNLKAIVFRSGAKALISEDKTLSRGQRGAGRLKEHGLVFYWLVKEVTQKPDPQALPERAQFETALLDTMEKHINRLLRNQ